MAKENILFHSKIGTKHLGFSSNYTANEKDVINFDCYSSDSATSVIVGGPR